jgi:glycosyltransferase involved in cell wall biosynthesis
LSFKTGDAKDLAEKMNFLLHNRSLRQEMGVKARAYAQRFSWDIIAEEYEQFLTDTAKQRGAS